MKRTSSFLVVFITISTVMLTCFQAKATPVVITNVPAYAQHQTSYSNEAPHWTGCYPTATAMALGYYKLHDYKNLFKTNGVAVYSTTNVLAEIGKLAELMKTDNAGWTDTSNLIPAIVSYTRSKGYFFTAKEYEFEIAGSNPTAATKKLWGLFTNEIVNCRPMLFYVNAITNRSADHLVTAIGYEDRGANGFWYGCYNTYNEAETNIMWYKFQIRSSSSYYGVSTMTQIKSKGRGGLIRVF